MTKYSFEFKEKVVQEYLSGEGSYRSLAKRYDIPSSNSIMLWVNSYNTFGEDGLLGGDYNKGYTFEYKRNMVELYLTTEISYLELAFRQGMKSPAAIQRWVQIAEFSGMDALNPRAKGLSSEMKESNGTNKLDKKKKLSDSEHLKQLEAENLKLRIENAYLKELRRLRLEENHPKKKRESSPASEENLD